MEENTTVTVEKRGFNREQAAVLADRYLETMLADFKGTLLLLFQAPFLAALVVVAWGNLDRATESLYFVMTLSCVWIGCIDACREIVKERSLFLRERMVNLEVGPYLYSKVRVLFLLNLVQVTTYVGIIIYYLDVRVHVVWLVVNLLATTFSGTCLGLLISAAVKRSDYAVGLVPLVILPQIVFSEFAIGQDNFSGFSEIVFAMMPSRWGYESLQHFSQTSVDYAHAISYMALPPLFGLGFLVLAYPLLALQKY